MLPHSSQYSAYGSGRAGHGLSQPGAAPSSDFDELFSSQPGPSSGFGHQPSQSTKRPRCPECGTRKMRLRAGQLICKRGHVQQFFRVEEAEGDEYIGDGIARKRRVQKTHRVRRLKSQHTPWYSQPETDVEPEDSEEDQLEHESTRAKKRPRSSSFRSAGAEEDEDELLEDSQDEGSDNLRARPYSIREDSFFERTPRSLRSYAASSAAEESGFESELDSHARASRRGIRSIWRSGVGLHGAFEGRFALLQCLQLVLRLQLQRLRELWGDRLPRETEAVARDLWAMFVSLLPVGHYPPEPLIAATFDWHTRTALSQERAAEIFPNHQTYDPEADIHAHRRTMLFNAFHHHCERSARGEDVAARRFPTQHADDRADAEDPGVAKECIDWIVGNAEDQSVRSRSQRSSEVESLADPEDELAQLDPVFAEQRRRQQAATSESEPHDTETEHGGQGGQGGRTRRKRKRRFLPPWATKNAVGTAQTEILQLATVPTTVSIVYLALHLLKVPVFWADLMKLIASYELPFLNVVHRLPLALTRSLNKDNVHHHLLDTDAVPSISALHLHTLGVAELLQRTYGVEFGDANVSGQLARMTEAMLLPPTFYVATKRLLDVVARGVTPQLLPSRSKGKQDEEDGKKAGLPGAALVQRLPKEFVLMAALLVTVKMRYGLDGQERCEGVGVDGALSCAPELDAWLAALDARRDRFRASKEAVPRVDPTELDPLSMSDDQLDAYASFVETNLVLSNHIDLHEWRRLEPQHRWAAFTKFIPELSDSNPQCGDGSGRGDGGGTKEWAELEADLRGLYRRHTARPGEGGLKAGERYVMHQFAPGAGAPSDADPLGLCYSPLYPRVMQHANEVVGIRTPQSASVAMDVLVDLECTRARTRGADAVVRTWEMAYGIQAHLEAVERMLDAETEHRARNIRRNLARKAPARSTESAPHHLEDEQHQEHEEELEEELEQAQQEQDQHTDEYQNRSKPRDT
ncbi:uncharacterized protein PAN0_002c1182 [Moesziomyces antarcticus]|uniref:Uncharacterized protein n=1 Tax=Pseudozyma antarctica TaxID=84753 RepID=A0A5C3FHD0_PSEA2|nr:uncharacterized protein PAN0_002c1182 [Moesziomyces antarcticus]GAK62980.1 conserved hypothetical protein [Moesziomyces antarcticus]SPO43536.1 uncharacterized protein PSANT_01221 [Moesziomyces antarcticus]